MGKGQSAGRGGLTPSAPSAEERRNQARAIELFHVVLMQTMAAELQPADFAVKGGVNLRFFLKSGRRSADIDLDYLGRNFGGFRDRMARVLAGATIPKILLTRDIRISDVRLRHDTETTKRWMLKLARPGMPDATSKIEFSNRESTFEPVLEQADTELARKLGGVAARLNHYAPVAAVAQKIEALIERKRTEPRDVFDLDHLFQQYADARASVSLEAGRLESAAKIAENIEYAQYQDLVEPFLDEDIVRLYSGDQAWLDMRIRVAVALRERAKVQP